MYRFYDAIKYFVYVTTISRLEMITINGAKLSLNWIKARDLNLPP